MLGGYASIANRSLYPVLAMRFQDTLKDHPPVSNCQLLFHQTEDQLTVMIELNYEKLIQYLANDYKIRRPTLGDAERYLTNFQKAIQKAASDVFVDIPINSIRVKTSFTNQ